MSDESVHAALRSAARLVIVEAPAGCGKTHQGAEFASDHVGSGTDRVLILTHTHAACSVFADRTKKATSRSEVRTIDSLIGQIASVYQRRFEVVARTLLAQNADFKKQLPQLDDLFSSIQICAFRNQLDLSRLTITPPSYELPVTETRKGTVNSTKSNAVEPLFRVPEAIAAALNELDKAVSKGEQIPWSADYFKYRILGVQPVPFSFSDVMQKAESVFSEPPYEEIKDIILDLLGKGGAPAILRQGFDLDIAADTKEASGRKEIVFGPAT